MQWPVHKKNDKKAVRLCAWLVQYNSKQTTTQCSMQWIVCVCVCVVVNVLINTAFSGRQPEHGSFWGDERSVSLICAVVSFHTGRKGFLLSHQLLFPSLSLSPSVTVYTTANQNLQIGHLLDLFGKHKSQCYYIKGQGAGAWKGSKINRMC